MEKMLDALRQRDSYTENGMKTNSTSLDSCVDLFFTIGALRNADTERVINTFVPAFIQNPTVSLKILFWARDIREGAGERKVFRVIIEHLAKNYPDVLEKNLKWIPEFGRWDDMLSFVDTPLEKTALEQIKSTLESDNPGLVAKWMPRKGYYAAKLRNTLGLSRKAYRKLLVHKTNVVETQMCNKDWSSIKFDKVPSLASARYQNAFKRNAPYSYQKYIESLQKGETKINASSVYPYDVIKSLKKGNKSVSIEQWKALPNYMEENDELILPVVDTSYSMISSVSSSKNLTCMDVSISLGLYISERNIGSFKDSFITFSERPQLQFLKGNLSERFNQLNNAHWGFNTNLEAVFDLILDKAKEFGISQSEMPTKILIISDMEFDAAMNSTARWGQTGHEMIQDKYSQSGYKMPDIIYWNVQSRNNNVPVSFNKTGTALISGFSPSIMKSILNGKKIDPVLIMNETIMIDRYKNIKA